MHAVSRKQLFTKVTQEARNHLNHWFLLPGGGLPVVDRYANIVKMLGTTQPPLVLAGTSFIIAVYISTTGCVVRKTGSIS